MEVRNCGQKSPTRGDERHLKGQGARKTEGTAAVFFCRRWEEKDDMIGSKQYGGDRCERKSERE